MFHRFVRSQHSRVLVAAGVSSVVATVTAGVQVQSSSCSSAVVKEETSNLVILSGTANRQLSEDVAKLLHSRLLDVTTRRFSDGEINCVINESIRGKDVFIVQTCAAPVNDNIMELLLTVAAARRAGAHNVTTVIPYFGYKYHRRGMPISTTYSSRFLWSAASDLAKMLQTVGVDNVVSVDLQRPGQGHEATFFPETIPVETINTSDIFADYFTHQIDPPLAKVVVVSANSQCVKKARKFQRKLKQASGLDEVDYAVFIGDATQKPSPHDLLGDVSGADVIIIDDIVGKTFMFTRKYFHFSFLTFIFVHPFVIAIFLTDTAAQLSVLCRRIKREGAGRVFICASHGLFTEKAMDLIDLSPVDKVVVTDSVPLPEKCSTKIAQVSIAPLLARVIETERHIRAHDFEESSEEQQMHMKGRSTDADDDEYIMDAQE